MKTHLLKIVLLLNCILFLQISRVNAAVITVTSVTTNAGTNGLALSPAYPQGGIVVYGLRLNNSSGDVTLKGVNFPGGFSNLNTIFSNAKLFISSSSSYSSSSVTQIAGNGVSGPVVTINSSSVVVTGLSRTISGSNNYVYLMVDYNNTGTSSFSGSLFYNPVISYEYLVAPLTATAYAGSPYYQFNPAAVNYTRTTTGTQTAGDIYPQNNLVLYGFSAKMAGATGTLTEISISSGNNNQLSTYFSNARLFRNTSNTYSGASQIAGTGFGGTGVSVSNGTITFTGLSQALTTTDVYYYLVIDYSYAGTTASSVQFNSVSTNYANTTSNTPGGNSYNLKTLEVSYTKTTTGIQAAGNIYPQNTISLYGFSAKMTGGSGTVTEITIGSNSTSLPTYFSNAKLFRNTTDNYGSATQIAGASFGATGLSLNNGTIKFTGLNEGLTTTNVYYYLVVDYSYTGTTSSLVQFNSVTTNYTTSSSNASGNSYNLLPKTINYSSATTGLTPVGSGIYPQDGVALYGFSAKMAGGTGTATQFAISGNNATLPTYFNNAKLFRNTTDSFSGATQIAGNGFGATTVNVTNGTVTFDNLSEALASTNVYYYLVLDYIYTGSTNSSVQFNDVKANYTTAGSSNTGTYYNLLASTVAINGNTTGLSSNTDEIAPGTTDIKMFSFSINVKGKATFSEFNIKASDVDNNEIYSTPNKYLSNVKLYVNSTASMTGATQIAGAGASVSGATISLDSAFIKITGLNQALTSTTTTGQTAYYFISADYIVYQGKNPGGVRFNFVNGQTYNQVVQNGPVSATYNTNNVTGSLYKFRANVTVASYTGADNGITQTVLNYEESTVVFAFSVQTLGTLNINQFNFMSYINGAQGQAGDLFNGGSLYTSLTSNFDEARPVAGASLNWYAFQNGMSFTGFSEDVSNTTRYFFVVLNYNNQHVTINPTVQFRFVNPQGFHSPVKQTSPAASFDNISAVGPIFNIGVTYDWTGESTDFFAASNYRNLNGGNFNSPPGPYDQVRIGVKAYLIGTNQPVVSTTNTTGVGKVTFGTNNSPTLTINNGITLNLNSGLGVNAGATAIIKSSATGGSAAVINTKGGGSVVASTGILKLSDNLTLNNTGKFSLKSDASGSATIAELPASVTITGNFSVERYISGGVANMRGYRLLSSPVHYGTSNNYSINYLAKKTWLTGTGAGFDKAGNPTLYLYRENLVPSSAAFTSGNYRGISAINAAPDYTLDVDGGPFNIPLGNGYLFFFRGDRSTTVASKTTAPFPIPESTTFAATGTLNRGTITVRHWASPSADTLLRTMINKTGRMQGYNLVGNPYPSSIDWNKFSATNSAAGIYGPGISDTICVLDPVSKNYAYYVANVTGTNNASSVIASGQGFFVKTIGAQPKLTFTEKAKVNTQATSNMQLLSVREAAAQVTRFIKLRVSQDSVNADESLIMFNSNAKKTFGTGDVTYNVGNGTVNLASLSADNMQLAINSVPLTQDIQQIKLSVKAPLGGNYQMKLAEIKNIPEIYEVWLKDNFRKDSLDIKHNANYNFNVVRTDTNTFGNNRFVLVIRQNPARAYRLLTFTGKKAVSGTELTWKAENAYDYTNFTVERSTDGGKTYTALETVRSNNQSDYNTIDASPVIGENKYRLKQVDFNEAVSYSNIVTLTYAKPVAAVAEGIAMSIYPNPTASNISLTINKPNEKGTYAVKVVNAAGYVVRSATFTQGQWQDNIGHLQAGVYFVQVVDNTTKQVVGNSKFVKL